MYVHVSRTGLNSLNMMKDTIIQAVYDTHNLQGDPIVSHYPPHSTYVDHVEGFLEVNEFDVHW